MNVGNKVALISLRAKTFGFRKNVLFDSFYVETESQDYPSRNFSFTLTLQILPNIRTISRDIFFRYYNRIVLKKDSHLNYLMFDFNI